MSKENDPIKDFPRLIEHAFPLKQASLDSVHEKNVRHGHISTLHIWPARRPLAACRAALIATLLPDPGTPEKRRELCEKIGGTVVEKIERKKMPNGRTVERIKEETQGGILHWKRETENARDLEWFRKEIRKAYGGRAPRVLDPFAGGGAIPLEAMRLGCETTAADINPVAWFILKCTLEYPQKLAGKTLPLPDFVLEDEGFMMDFFTKAKGYSKAEAKKAFSKLEKSAGARKSGQMSITFDDESALVDIGADLAWQVRAWGRWVLDKARRELAPFYPTYADFEPLDPREAKPFEPKPMRPVPLKEDGTPDIDVLNADFSPDYLKDKGNPRWVAKTTVAYLWARTVTCKNCRATVPLLKTRWLCKKAGKRVLLTMAPNADSTGVVFGIQNDVLIKGGNAAQKREHDKKIGVGTMTRAGANCPCCGLPSMTMEDIRVESSAGRSGMQLTAVVIVGSKTKEYRTPTEEELNCVVKVDLFKDKVFSRLKMVSLNEPFEPASTRSISAHLYGIKRWSDLYTSRQLYALSAFGKAIHLAYESISKINSNEIWNTAIIDYICLGLDRLLCFLCVNACWKPDADSLNWAFSRFSISILWDFAEAQPLGTTAGSFIRCCDRIASAIDILGNAGLEAGLPKVLHNSATKLISDCKLDLIITDPPYYQAVSYADLSDFSYTWLRGIRPIHTIEFEHKLTNKTQEVVQHIHKNKSRTDEREKYENQMAEAFSMSRKILSENGRFVCVFAHKDPEAWETLVNAIIRAGFIVSGSWPIQTEMPTRQRASGAAVLASSVWLICKPRSIMARPGWDNNVLQEMRGNIAARLHEFWDAGIRGPDFVWAATGPALEAYSKHPVVKKANTPGQVMTVGEFLTHARRMVVDFVVGQVLTGQGEGTDLAAADRMDAPTAYYLLHRHDFGLDEAPAGACILYATACGLSDQGLETTWNILDRADSRKKQDAQNGEENPEEEGDSPDEAGSGSMVRLQAWSRRKHRSMGYEAPGGQPVPLIDRIHRLMHLWRAGEAIRVDEYLDDNGLRRHELFKRLLQSLIELAAPGSEERKLLESLSNHVQARGAAVSEPRAHFDVDE